MNDTTPFSLFSPSLLPLLDESEYGSLSYVLQFLPIVNLLILRRTSSYFQDVVRVSLTLRESVSFSELIDINLCMSRFLDKSSKSRPQHFTDPRRARNRSKAMRLQTILDGLAFLRSSSDLSLCLHRVSSTVPTDTYSTTTTTKTSSHFVLCEQGDYTSLGTITWCLCQSKETVRNHYYGSYGMNEHAKPRISVVTNVNERDDLTVNATVEFEKDGDSALCLLSRNGVLTKTFIAQVKRKSTTAHLLYTASTFNAVLRAPSSLDSLTTVIDLTRIQGMDYLWRLVTVDHFKRFFPDRQGYQSSIVVGGSIRDKERMECEAKLLKIVDCLIQHDCENLVIWFLKEKFKEEKVDEECLVLIMHLFSSHSWILSKNSSFGSSLLTCFCRRISIEVRRSPLTEPNRTPGLRRASRFDSFQGIRTEDETACRIFQYLFDGTPKSLRRDTVLFLNQVRSIVDSASWSNRRIRRSAGACTGSFSDYPILNLLCNTLRVDVNVRIRGETALEVALKNRAFPVIGWLMKRRPHPHVPSDGWFRANVLSCGRVDRIEVITAMLKNYSCRKVLKEMQLSRSTVNDLIHLAVELAPMDFVERLVELSSGCLSFCRKNGKTPLMVACEHHRLDVVDLFLKASSILIRAVDSRQATCLHWLSSSQQVWKSTYSNPTLDNELHSEDLIVGKVSVRIVRRILKEPHSGDLLPWTNSEGKTAVDVALESRNLPTAFALMDRGGFVSGACTSILRLMEDSRVPSYSVLIHRLLREGQFNFSLVLKNPSSKFIIEKAVKSSIRLDQVDHLRMVWQVLSSCGQVRRLWPVQINNEDYSSGFKRRSNSHSLLNFALHESAGECLRFLIEDLEVPSSESSPFHVLAQRGPSRWNASQDQEDSFVENAFSLLIDHYSSEVHSEDSEGRIPIEIALNKYNFEVARLLIPHLTSSLPQRNVEWELDDVGRTQLLADETFLSTILKSASITIPRVQIQELMAQAILTHQTGCLRILSLEDQGSLLGNLPPMPKPPVQFGLGTFFSILFLDPLYSNEVRRSAHSQLQVMKEARTKRINRSFQPLVLAVLSESWKTTKVVLELIPEEMQSAQCLSAVTDFYTFVMSSKCTLTWEMVLAILILLERVPDCASLTDLFEIDPDLPLLWALANDSNCRVDDDFPFASVSLIAISVFAVLEDNVPLLQQLLSRVERPALKFAFPVALQRGTREILDVLLRSSFGTTYIHVSSKILNSLDERFDMLCEYDVLFPILIRRFPDRMLSCLPHDELVLQMRICNVLNDPRFTSSSLLEDGKYTLLHLCCAEGRSNEAELLLEAGADVNAQSIVEPSLKKRTKDSSHRRIETEGHGRRRRSRRKKRKRSQPEEPNPVSPVQLAARGEHWDLVRLLVRKWRADVSLDFRYKYQKLYMPLVIVEVV